MNCFFSNKYADRTDLFEGLSIWKEEKYRKLQGTFPVIFLSFADVKKDNYQDAIWKIKKIILVLYQQFSEILSWDGFSLQQRKQFQQITPDMSDVMAQSALQDLCGYLSAYYRKKILIFLDEYDTPLQEAYVHGYWDKLAAFTRGMFNSTFKTNPCLERAIMTGNYESFQRIHFFRSE